MGDHRSGTSDQRRRLGASGEDRAAEWYRRAGWTVVDRNWRSRQGEIDLVARRGAVLVFCEVKTRRGDRFGEPFEAVTALKAARIRRLAGEWLRARGPGLGHRPDEIRFDVASVRPGRVEVIEGAF